MQCTSMSLSLRITQIVSEAFSGEYPFDSIQSVSDLLSDFWLSLMQCIHSFLKFKNMVGRTRISLRRVDINIHIIQLTGQNELVRYRFEKPDILVRLQVQEARDCRDWPDNTIIFEFQIIHAKAPMTKRVLAMPSHFA